MRDPTVPMRLLLLRHAKSEGDAPGRADHDRPLSSRGRAAAPRMGAYMRRCGYLPNSVLCSSARRTQETLERLGPWPGVAPAVRVLRELYLASPAELLACIRQVPPSVETLLVVAHNPGIAQLASLLSERGDAALRTRVRSEFPTGALAAFLVRPPGWIELRCELSDFATPRGLPPDAARGS